MRTSCVSGSARPRYAPPRYGEKGVGQFLHQLEQVGKAGPFGLAGGERGVDAFEPTGFENANFDYSASSA
jgi:hypothetical protein